LQHASASDGTGLMPIVRPACPGQKSSRAILNAMSGPKARHRACHSEAQPRPESGPHQRINPDPGIPPL